MTAKRFTVDSDGKWWDRVSHKYVTIDHLFYLVEELEKENEQLKEELKQTVFINLDSEDGCWNCKHCYGGFCEILKNPMVTWLKGVSKCNLKKWELKE